MGFYAIIEHCGINLLVVFNYIPTAAVTRYFCRCKVHDASGCFYVEVIDVNDVGFDELKIRIGY
jgi:hypothetical protein